MILVGRGCRRRSCQRISNSVAIREQAKGVWAPHCLSRFDDQSNERFDFLYLKPSHVHSSRRPASLPDLLALGRNKRLSLSKRITLAHVFIRCLIYLHYVNWLHKDTRSSNIFFIDSNGDLPAFSYPILVAFGYNMSGRVDEASDGHEKDSERLYRYLDVVKGVASGLQKAYDVYGMGTILVEISGWQRIDEILKVAREAP